MIKHLGRFQKLPVDLHPPKGIGGDEKIIMGLFFAGAWRPGGHGNRTNPLGMPLKKALDDGGLPAARGG